MTVYIDEEMDIKWDRMRALLVRAKAANESDNFQMEKWFTNPSSITITNGEVNWCGSAGCLAGHTITMWENPLWVPGVRNPDVIRIKKGSTPAYEGVAAGLLGLDSKEAHFLFRSPTTGEVPNYENDEYDYIDFYRDNFSGEERALYYLEKCIEAERMIPPQELFKLEDEQEGG